MFHNDTHASAGIGPNGEYNCFTCGAKAHNSAGFIAKYFQISFDRAKSIRYKLNNLQKYKYNQQSVTQEQLKYLKGLGFSDPVIQKYFFCSSVGKLIFKQTWNGINVGYTWFNPTVLSAYNASAPKYKYDKNNIGGILTPYDDVIKYKTLIVTEGEKDMLIAKSLGIKNAVAKVGGAKTYMLGGLNIQDKQIVLVYDCDNWGREGAINDAVALQNRFNCKVKVVDLGLPNKGEDLHDYFVKYKHTKQDFYNLIKATPLFVAPPDINLSRVEKFVKGLSTEEFDELKKIIKKEKQDV